MLRLERRKLQREGGGSTGGFPERSHLASETRSILVEVSVATVERTTRKELSFSVGCSRVCCASSSASDWAGAAALSWRLALASAVEGKDPKGRAESGVDGAKLPGCNPVTWRDGRRRRRWE